MIDWKQHTQKQIPEIVNVDFNTIHIPMDLWIELNFLFDKAINQEHEDLIKRIFTEAYFYLEYSNKPNDLGTAVALAFIEHLLDDEKKIPYVLKYFSKQDFINYKAILMYHNDEKKYSRILALYGK